LRRLEFILSQQKDGTARVFHYLSHDQKSNAPKALPIL
jgi:hypothetical protein